MGSGDSAGPREPLAERRVEAAGDRIFDQHAVLRKERPHLDRLRRTRRVGADQPDVEVGVRRPYGEHGLRDRQLDGDPARPRPLPGRRER